MHRRTRHVSARNRAQNTSRFIINQNIAERLRKCTRVEECLKNFPLNDAENDQSRVQKMFRGLMNLLKKCQIVKIDYNEEPKQFSSHGEYESTFLSVKSSFY